MQRHNMLSGSVTVSSIVNVVKTKSEYMAQGRLSGFIKQQNKDTLQHNTNWEIFGTFMLVMMVVPEMMWLRPYNGGQNRQKGDTQPLSICWESVIFRAQSLPRTTQRRCIGFARRQENQTKMQ